MDSINPIQELLQAERDASDLIKQAQHEAKIIRKNARKEAHDHLEKFKNSKETEFKKLNEITPL